MGHPGTTERGPTPARRLTVAQLMAVVAVLSLALAAARSPSIPLSLANLAVLALLLTPLALDRLNRRCPDCGERSVVWVRSVPFRDVYYRCRNCGARWKRPRLGRLRRAKGPSDDEVFRRKLAEGRWQGAPVEVAEEGPQGELLAHKRNRGPLIDVDDVPPDLTGMGWIGPTAADEAPGPIEPIESRDVPRRLLEVKRRLTLRRGQAGRR